MPRVSREGPGTGSLSSDFCGAPKMTSRCRDVRIDQFSFYAAGK